MGLIISFILGTLFGVSLTMVIIKELRDLEEEEGYWKNNW